MSCGHRHDIQLLPLLTTALISFHYTVGSTHEILPYRQKYFFIYCNDLNYEHLGDSEYFNGLKSGNRVVVQSIYKQFLPKISRWVMSNNGSQQDAEDVFQESLEIILLKIDALNSSFLGLLMQISKRRWIDRLRKNKSGYKLKDDIRINKENDLVDESELSEKEVLYHRYKLMESTFEQLSETCRKILSLMKKGVNTQEIVIIMSLNSVNTLYRRKAACIGRWAKLVKEYKKID